ncbi:putative DotD protein [Piscirickettsia salmonis]|uniref:Type IV secretion system protein DotD n=1 Tax=Piscirickettsia salmonis TaxID=1238 RepID=A0A1L6TE86_PISSA|nr:DotD/TraH family lipoprotein [Piscirickettsia salmonis]AKP72734.1 hypothetical protein PSLF89_608 [Piscirickettsia salmonis LF-89 = ATCC VR-1361]ALB23762.1 type IV secretion system protein DotD [Piscirickettsia salmonis]ALY03609.1 hypothetical protein AWE47_12750 [Piscirickettsia salmonis]AMA43173.1 hypothetical protein AWJ11_12980 [Piscirickettsia salmonis]AOS35645.1 hypothetical protein AVM72_10105 [Piscirickettsia salmonis]
MKDFLIITCFSIIVILQGCSSQPIQVDPQLITGTQLEKNKEIKKALLQAVAQTSKALASLSQIRRAQYPRQQVMPFKNIHSSELNKKVSINWYGPINSIVKNIAEVIGFDYQEFGKPPKLPVLVNINYQSMPALTVLQNIELQANNKAMIEIVPDKKIISLRYMAND